MGSIACEHCTGACCRYLALPIDPPRTARDYDDLRWYLLHEGIGVFVEEGEWYIQIQTTCRHLGPDSRCQIYETRPAICEDYKAVNCDYGVGPYNYEHHFVHASQLERYYADKTGKPLAKQRGGGNGTGPRIRRRTQKA